VFWGDNSLFRRLFEMLDTTAVLELGCGHGRHIAEIIGRAGAIIMVDVNPDNIAACKERFRGVPNMTYIVNSGHDLREVSDNTHTAVFSYDAMVHFEAHDIIMHLRKFVRVLRPTGRALLHYSNFDLQPRAFFADNPGGRSFFSERMMLHFADRAGLRVIESHAFHWPIGGRPNHSHPTDALSLLEKI
jgi:ubiquinone/menaquinone biosynthesis C-methylase UbiE